jgi:hypothetical protein
MQNTLLSETEDEDHHSEVVIPSPNPRYNVATVESQESRSGAQKEGNVGHGISQRLQISSQRHSRSKWRRESITRRSGSWAAQLTPQPSQ